MMDCGFMERTLGAYPGKISAVVSLPHHEKCSETNSSEYTTRDMDIIKENLHENPMVSAILFDMCSCKSWDNHKDIVSWAKANNLSIGMETRSNGLIEINKAIAENNVDFVRLTIGLKDIESDKNLEVIKKSIAKVRNSGTQYEVCLDVGSTVDIESIKKAYIAFSPCSNFVVQGNKKMSTSKKESLINLSKENKNMILRIWN